MKISSKSLIPFFTISVLLSLADTALAAIAPTATIESFGISAVKGHCSLVITTDEPYSHFNASCDMEKDGQLIGEKPLDGQEIGYPRSQTIFVWAVTGTDYAMDGDEYCAKFEIPDTGKIEMGHYDDPDENKEIDGATAHCSPPPSPPSVGCASYFLGCPAGCGHSPYILSWNSSTATSYQVQHKFFGSWNSYYSGTSLSTLASTGTTYNEQFRVRGVNGAGPGNWCTIWIQVQCSETQDPW